MNQCQCDDAGWCDLMRREMSAVRHHECKHKPHYFEMFLKQASRQVDAPQTVTPIAEGVGTEIEKLIAWMKPGGCDNCLCDLRARTMDKRGIDWCEKRIDKIVGWLRQGAAQCGMPFSRIVARQVTKLAIHNAKARKLSGGTDNG